jgi:hypothetical protein
LGNAGFCLVRGGCGCVGGAEDLVRHGGWRWMGWRPRE